MMSCSTAARGGNGPTGSETRRNAPPRHRDTENLLVFSVSLCLCGRWIRASQGVSTFATACLHLGSVGVMVHRRQATALAVAVTLVFAADLIAQKKDDKKQDEAQKKELQSVLKLVDDVAAGMAQPPNDLSLTWVREDFIKAQGSKEYVPFVVTIDSSKIGSGNLVFYWRVAPKGAASAAPAPAAKDDKKDKDKDKAKPRVEYPYEDYNVVPVTQAAAPGGPMKIARSFTVPTGTYDVFVVAKEAVPMTPPPKGAPPFVPKTSVMKQSVTVPDFWNGELSTSTVLVAERIDPLPAPLTPQQQEERPYAL